MKKKTSRATRPGQLFVKPKTADVLFMAYDIVAVSVAYFLALWFRFDGRFSLIPREYLMTWANFAPIYAVICIGIFWVLHLYQSLWRFVGILELKRIFYSGGLLAVIHVIG